MKSVYEFDISTDDYVNIDLPLHAEVLSIQVQHGKPQLWCLVNPNEIVYETRKFRFAGTGHPIQEENLDFIGTFQLYEGSFVGHLFEVK